MGLCAPTGNITMTVAVVSSVELANLLLEHTDLLHTDKLKNSEIALTNSLNPKPPDCILKVLSLTFFTFESLT